MWPRRRGGPSRPPEWGTQVGPERAGRRVLFEHADGAVREVMARELSQLGYDVLTCGGPRDAVGCPVLQQQPCPAVEGADVVVTGLLNDERGRFIARRIRQHHPDIDLIAEATEWTAEQVDRPVANRRVFPLRSQSLAEMMGPAAAR